MMAWSGERERAKLAPHLQLTHQTIMKNYILTQDLPCQQAITKALQQAGDHPVLSLGLDIELAAPAGALIIGGATPLDLGKHPRESWLALCRWLVAQGCVLHVAQEACGFGWQFHRRLEAAGACSVVVASADLNGQRKTDKRDARALAVALWDRTQRGNSKALRPVRIPSPPEQQRRARCRQRSQCLEIRHRFEAHGRSLLWDHDWLEVPEGWWKPRVWARLKAALATAGREWLLSMLVPHQQMLATLQARITQLEALITPDIAEDTTSADSAATAPPAVIPRGLGAPTCAQLHAEVMDWGRFANRGQAGSFIGCCPSERSSGGRQRLGSIDRMGSKRIRTMLVEAVWRLRHWNPGWRGFARFPHVFGVEARCGSGQKKKAIVACARLLMIDLWRINTGRATLAGLGLLPA